MAQNNAFNIMKLDKFINMNIPEDLSYYAIMAEMNSSARKISEEEIYRHIFQKLNQIFADDENKYNKNVTKYLFALTSYFEIKKEKNESPSLDIIVKCKTISSQYKKYATNCNDTDIKKNVILIGFLESYINGLLNTGGKTFDELTNEVQSAFKAIVDREEEKDFDISEYLKVLDVQNNDFQRKFFNKYSELIEEAAQKDGEIKNLELEIADLKKQLEKLKKSAEASIKKSSTSKGEVTQLTNETKKLEKEIKNLNKKISELESEKEKEIERSTYLTEDNNNYLIRINELLSKTTSLESQIVELNDLIEFLNSQITEYEKLKTKDLDNDFLDELVVRLILDIGYTIDGLVIKLKESGYEYKREDIIASLKRIRNKGLTIENPKIITIPKMYEISEPQVLTNVNLPINIEPNSCLDLFVMSDLHMFEVSEELKARMDCVYNYCENNSISTILNLGDLLEGQSSMPKDYENFSESKRLINDIIENFPTDPNVMHVILGGNHDKSHLRFGIDPLREIANNREDILSVGYDHASISFPSNNNEYFMIHHGFLPREDAFENDKQHLDEEANKIIRKEYSKNNLVYDDSYVDLYGHQHKARFDQNRKQVLVPSLSRNTYGAYHLKVYFDSNKKIKYMLFIPLYMSRAREGFNLYQQSEVLYEKPSR